MFGAGSKRIGTAVLATAMSAFGGLTAMADEVMPTPRPPVVAAAPMRVEMVRPSVTQKVQVRRETTGVRAAVVAPAPAKRPPAVATEKYVASLAADTPAVRMVAPKAGPCVQVLCPGSMMLGVAF